MTEDDPSRCERRPEWAKAGKWTDYACQMLFHDSGNNINTAATTPVVSPMPMGDHLREKAIFIERSALQDLEEIYQGMSWFGHNMAPCMQNDFTIIIINFITFDYI